MKTQFHSQGSKIKDRDGNRDPFTRERGAHPVGTGLGAAGGATAGIALVAVAGPVGAAAGLLTGAVAGALTGRSLAESVNPTAEDAYWKSKYLSRPYVETDVPYDVYAPAYRVGYEGRALYHNLRFEEAESKLQRHYEAIRGKSPLTWDQAREASRDAWQRIERALPGDADGDGRQVNITHS